MMLALPQRRQHWSLLPSVSTSSISAASTTTQLRPHHLQTESPATIDTIAQRNHSHPPTFDSQLLHHYLESQRPFAGPSVSPAAATAATAFDLQSPSSYMHTSTLDLANPSIRIQQSTPTPLQPVMLSTAASTGHDGWSSYRMQNERSLRTPSRDHEAKPHQRASSSSSVGSTGSQYHVAGQSAAFSAFSNHLPTPTQTPTQDAFVNASKFNALTAQTSTDVNPTMAAHMSMKQALIDQHVPEEDVPGFSHSSRHSVSSYAGQDSPATPLTMHGEELDLKMASHDTRQHTVPKFERTFTDVAADYSFDPNAVATQVLPQSKPAAHALLSPYRSQANDMIQRSLQAAQMARSQSPSSGASRGDSPFRRSSPYRQPSNSLSSPRVAVASAAAARERKAEAEAAHAMKGQPKISEDVQPKTISPKEVSLTYHDSDDASNGPLFPDSDTNDFDQHYNGSDQFGPSANQSTFDPAVASYQKDAWSTPQFSPHFQASVAATSQAAPSFAFAAPSTGANLNALSYTSSPQYRSAAGMSTGSEQNPEFPAHLTSMESSASEAGPEFSSQSSDRLLQKPADSKSGSGTYTCTYHGCTQRFETPQKLQKHKRDGHRSAANVGAGVGSGMTSAALLERNSQAGPHKCERINPTTGKPCNTIFSRPYDLTRHEDTIHNIRKQKVRCALCVEDKTFSRNDALTRHMRVVHPEVDFPGKHRRRGGNHD